MKYYFAGWDSDSEDIFALMESWWKDTPLSEFSCDIDRDAFYSLFKTNSLFCICSRDEAGKLVACFVGFVIPDLYRKGKVKLDQLAACFSKEHRNAHNYLEMVDTVERLCKKLNIDRVGISTTPRMAKVINKRKNYTLDTVSLTKEI